MSAAQRADGGGNAGSGPEDGGGRKAPEPASEGASGCRCGGDARSVVGEDTVTLIGQLYLLHRAGALRDDEFEIAKQRALSRLATARPGS